MQARGQGCGLGRDLGHGLEDSFVVLRGVGLLREVAKRQVAPACDAALGGLLDARDQLEHGGLAAAILADQADAVALDYLEVNLVEDRVARVVFTDFGELDEKHMAYLVRVSIVDTRGLEGVHYSVLFRQARQVRGCRQGRRY